MSEQKNTLTGQWITTDDFYKLSPIALFHRQISDFILPESDPSLQNRHILFRRKFTLGAVRKCTIRITADDYYKLYVNGRFISQGPAAGYPQRYFYNELDLTDFVNPGENTIAVHSYYQGLINRVWVSGDLRHGLCLDLTVDDKLILASDESFRCAYHSGFSQAGIVGYKTQYLERYNAAAPEVGFEKPVFDDSAWNYARIRTYVDYQLLPQPSRQLCFEEIKPVHIFQWGNIIRADFATLNVGYLTYKAKGEKGSEVIMRFAQELNEDGSLRYKMRANCDYLSYMHLSGSMDTLNEFDYKAFRYVELELPEGCEVDFSSICFISRHYPYELKEKCNSEDPRLQAIWKLCTDSLHYGIQEVIQDCMEREKGYYLGDGCYSMLAYALTTRDFSLMEKLFDDFLATKFINRGLMTCGACSFMQEIAEYPFIMIILLWEYCELTHNYEFIRQRYEAFVDILDYYHEEYAEDDGLLNNLDKWCVVEWPNTYRDGYEVSLREGTVCTEKHNVINAYYIGAIKSLNKIAARLGVPPYLEVEELEKAFVSAFYLPEKKLFRDSITSNHVSQPGNVFAAFFGLFPDEAGKVAAVQMIREKRYTGSMFFVTVPMLAFLAVRGEKELFYDLLTDEGAWLKSIAEGHKRTIEGWGKDGKWNTSLFHLTMTMGAIFLMDWNMETILNYQ